MSIAKGNAIAARSVHIPQPAHLVLRKLQLQLEEERHITIPLGELAGALIAMGALRPLEEITSRLEDSGPAGNMALDE